MPRSTKAAGQSVEVKRRGRKPSVARTTDPTPFKIVDNIPLPPVRGEEAKKLKETLAVLKQGQSFLMPGKLIHTLKNVIVKQPKVFSCHKEGDLYRIWKR